MAKTVADIRAQIEKLRVQEQAILKKESVLVIQRIKEAVAHYGLTPDDIFGAGSQAPAASKRAAKSKVTKAPKVAKRKGAATSGVDAQVATKPNPAKGVKVAAKYKDDAGNSWSGRGSQPRWLRAAIESGKTLEDFTVA